MEIPARLTPDIRKIETRTMVSIFLFRDILEKISLIRLTRPLTVLPPPRSHML